MLTAQRHAVDASDVSSVKLNNADENFLSYDKLHGVDGALIAHTLRVHGACSS